MWTLLSLAACTGEDPNTDVTRDPPITASDATADATDTVDTDTVDTVDTDSTGDTGDTDSAGDTGAGPGLSFTAALSDTNLITLTWSDPTADPAGDVYVFDLGTFAAVCDGADGCSTTLRVEDGGIYEYTLRIPAIGEPAVYARAEVEVVAPEPPTFTADPAAPPLSYLGRTVALDVLDPVDVTLRWDEGARPPGTIVRLRTPTTSAFSDGDEVALTDEVVIPAADLERIGTSSWSLEACTLPAAADVPLCSQETPLSLRVVPGLVEGGRRIQADANGVTLDWASAGNFFYVSAPTLGIDTWVAGPPLHVAALDPGVHDVTIVPCRFETGQCTNRSDAVASAAGIVSYPYPLLDWGVIVVFEGDPVADIDTGSGVETLVAPATGTLFEVVAEGDAVEAGGSVFAVITQDAIQQQLVVDDVRWTLDRPWTDDFAAGQATAAWPRFNVGSPLDIAIEDDGNVWVDSEFTWRLFHARPDGTGEALTYPLLQHWDEATERYVPVSPFANGLSGLSPHPASAYGERVVVAPDGTVWATLGGVGLHEGGDPPNHSRLLQFDPAATDLPTTEHDDRFCAYAVPGDGNGVIGLAVDGAQVWFVEGTPGYLSVFEPRPELCEPLLDYDDPAAVAASVMVACGPGQHASDGCVERVYLGDGRYPAHVAIDPVDGSPWVSDAFGGVLLHYVPATGAVESIPLQPQLMSSFFAGFPWQIRVTDDAVYLGEYADVSLVRYTKATGEMDELPVPFATGDVNLHSIDIDDQERLWFTLSAEGSALLDPEASTIGYVDLADWRDGSPSGVVYAGLDAIVDAAHPERAELWAPCFRGIDVAPDGGAIALASMRRAETVVLTPR